MREGLASCYLENHLTSGTTSRNLGKAKVIRRHLVYVTEFFKPALMDLGV